MREIREKIDKIFERLPRKVAAGDSPIRLTDLGRAVSGQLNVGAWADRHAVQWKSDFDGKQAYEIQEFCFSHVDGEDVFSDVELRAIKQNAYENGLDEEQVRRVYAIELRDRLLALNGLDAP